LYNTSHGQISEVLPVSDPPLGVLDSLEYGSFEHNLNAKDRLFLYTDGISEARNKRGEEFGLERIQDILIKHRTSSVKQVICDLKDEAIRFQQGLSQHDDITLILLDFSA
jgi:sigma-B regulation protein RsbU (phosphoserine phosphatase)